MDINIVQHGDFNAFLIVIILILIVGGCVIFGKDILDRLKRELGLKK